MGKSYDPTKTRTKETFKSPISMFWIGEILFPAYIQPSYWRLGIPPLHLRPA